MSVSTYRVIVPDCPFEVIVAEVRRDWNRDRVRTGREIDRHSGIMQLATVYRETGKVSKFLDQPRDAAKKRDRRFIAGGVRRVRSMNLDPDGDASIRLPVVHRPRDWRVVT